MSIVKCRVQRYDPDVTEPPFEFITLGELEIDKPDVDYLGEQFAENLSKGCYEAGYAFKFYSLSDEDDYVFNVTVY